jgi:hypothetical protein
MGSIQPEKFGNCAEIGGARRTAAFTNSGRSNIVNIGNLTGSKRPEAAI